ncbi:MAG: hypothetical protein UX39_C0010G0005 [Candidatus Magasanikbacteria bacterium GW2011_GWA2_46_17]|uniref:DUF6938 domain-containing protein n=1 Tax=Candidatus Magasanikbacteria bacterium GW2011_GWA2_46_17 TaxID=1619042 RepID=A0A0G1R8B4_9BACT|nr:MAG: hypothetical protein UX39_C0010G0005 [Candidatus Magasanikbacteria bacterium GW2011_GWA2_46_17]
MSNSAWVVAVDMGYGHQRAAYPLRHLSPTGKVIIANNYQGIPSGDYAIWKNIERFYEWFSRLNNIPVIGRRLFGIMDTLQEIPEFYPRRDLSAPTMQVKTIYSSIHRGWGRDLVEYLNTEDIPLITTFFSVAFFAEEHGFKNDIYTVLCDADISRAWVALNPAKSRIKYLAPCRRVVERLKLYGVKKENIYLTGFPLPEENLGGDQLKTLRADLGERLLNLDPAHHFRQKYSETLKRFLEEHIDITAKHNHPLTITFAVGGAGAQRALARNILVSLKKKLLKQEVNLNLVAGARNDVYLYFKEQLTSLSLAKLLNKNINIVFAVEKEDYFTKFNDVLRSTDMLWTKPSELSFYSALGLPVIMAPTIGSQEIFNKRWLTAIGAGLPQDNPHFTHEWLFDWVESGWLAEAAMSAFLDGRQFGVRNIKKVVFEGEREPAGRYQLM